jgi:ATP-dependent Clp protease ATP-binding subunit ClpA
MLLPELTTGTRRAVIAAVAWANARMAPVDAVATLLGLLTEEEGRPIQLFMEQGLTGNAIRQALEIAPVELNLADDLPANLDAYLQRLLYEARLHALQLTGSGTVFSEHLLLALLEENAALRAKLEAIGFSLARLRNRLEADVSAPLQLDEPVRLV